jgi:hypothetical protein
VSGSGTSSETVTTLSSVARIRATVYGNPITNTPEDRAYNAFDQNPDTRWAEGAFGSAVGAQLQVTLKKPVTTSEIRFLQPQTGPRNRWITRINLTFDGRRTVTRTLHSSSRREPGEEVHFPTETFKKLTITVDATSSGIRKNYNGFSGVGFAEVDIPGVAPVTQTLRLPTALLKSVGQTSITHPLVVLMNRIRTATVPPRSDPEPDMSRSFSLPTARTFSVGGSVRIAATDSDPVIDQIVGRTPVSISGPAALKAPEAEVVYANSSGRLPGDLDASAYAAIDDNPATSWMPGFGPQDGNWLLYAFDRPVTFGNLNLQVVTDGRHSIATKITISTGVASRVVTLPAIPAGKGRPQGSTTTVPITFPALTGQEVKITIDQTRPLKELDYYSTSRQTDPVGIAEVGFPGVGAPPTPPTTTSACLANLLTIDGTPVDVRVSGSTTAGLSGDALQISGCGNSANGVTLSAGSHMVQTATSEADGLDLDSLWLSSASGGSALALSAAGTIALPTPATSVAAHVVHQDRTHVTVKVTGTGTPYWLVLGQSQSAGWTASIQGGEGLGSSTLIDGYANGWLISGAEASGTRVFDLSWTPQKVIDAALIASAITLVGSVGIVVLPGSLLAWAWTGSRRLLRRRRFLSRKRPHSTPDEPAHQGAAAEPVHEEERVPSTSLFTSAWIGTGRGLSWPVRRLRRHSDSTADEPAHEEDSTHTQTSQPGPVATPSPGPEEPVRELVPAGPELTSVLSTQGQRPHVLFMLVAGILSGAVAGAITAPIAAPIVFGAVLVGCLIPWSRLLFVLAPLGLLGATGAYMVVQQDRHQYLSNIQWPQQFPIANTLTWIAVCALLAGAVVEIARWRSWLAGGAFEQLAVAPDEASTANAPLLSQGPSEETEGQVCEASEHEGEVVTETSEQTDVEVSQTSERTGVVTEASAQVEPAPSEGLSEKGPDPVAAEKSAPSPGPDEPGSSETALVADPLATASAQDGDDSAPHKGPVRSALGRTARWLRSRLPGTVSSPAEVPNGGEPPSDNA